MKRELSREKLQVQKFSFFTPNKGLPIFEWFGGKAHVALSSAQ